MQNVDVLNHLFEVIFWLFGCLFYFIQIRHIFKCFFVRSVHSGMVKSAVIIEYKLLQWFFCC